MNKLRSYQSYVSAPCASSGGCGPLSDTDAGLTSATQRKRRHKFSVDTGSLNDSEWRPRGMQQRLKRPNKTMAGMRRGCVCCSCFGLSRCGCFRRSCSPDRSRWCSGRRYVPWCLCAIRIPHREERRGVRGSHTGSGGTGPRKCECNRGRCCSSRFSSSSLRSRSRPREAVGRC